MQIDTSTKIETTIQNDTALNCFTTVRMNQFSKTIDTWKHFESATQISKKSIQIKFKLKQKYKSILK